MLKECVLQTFLDKDKVEPTEAYLIAQILPDVAGYKASVNDTATFWSRFPTLDGIL